MMLANTVQLSPGRGEDRRPGHPWSSVLLVSQVGTSTYTLVILAVGGKFVLFLLFSGKQCSRATILILKGVLWRMQPCPTEL